jgi:hypothetical protein
VKSKVLPSRRVSLPFCPRSGCQPVQENSGEGPRTGSVVRFGFFRRTEDARLIPRFFCKQCRRTFSRATLSVCFRQKKRRLNSKVQALYCSQVSQRRMALLLRVNLKTVTRKFLFLAAQAKLRRLGELERLRTEQPAALKALYFDEMESFERSKCLPLSIPLAVVPKTRRILSFRVVQMPSKGMLASISRLKYGQREDHRSSAGHSLFHELSALIHPQAEIFTDENPKYPSWIRPHLSPGIQHRTFKGRRGCVVGQGELKKIGFDPLFDLNHTCAMLRANINRLARRTWCTSKRRDRLEAHIELYVDFHNSVLTS